jgi:ornithine--oxo-acid transaminase
MNSGAEAVETAIKLARKWGQTVKGVPADQGEILVFDNNFHGRTTTIVGFSSSPQYREGFGPVAGGYRLLPFGDADAVAAAMNERTIAILVEPIQGEAGIVIPRRASPPAPRDHPRASSTSRRGRDSVWAGHWRALRLPARWDSP